MPRSEARLFNAIWKDREWRSFPVSARHLYSLLLTQDDLTYCGLIPLREARWSRVGTVSVASVRDDLGTLTAARYVVVDRDTDELLVRSLARRDRVLLQPQLWNPFADSVRQIISADIRVAMLAEMVRCRSEGLVNRSNWKRLDDLVSSLERSLDSQVGSLDGSLRASPASSLPGSLQGEGERYGSNHRSSLIPEPPPPVPGPAQRVTSPPAAGAVTEGEGVSTGTQDPPRAEVDALVREIRSLRPDWSERSVRRVLKSPDVTDRPWPLVVAAFPGVAKDPESKSPGRLAHDGPWWHRKGSAAAPAPRPPWCGECDEATRLAESVTGSGAPTRCKNCHPLEVA